MKQIFPGKRAFHLDEGYSGPLRSTPYFEGWYLRQVTADKSRSLAVIIGLSLSPDPHAFIQLLFGPEGRVLKFRYRLDELTARRDRFEVTLGENRFSPEGLELNISKDGELVKGRLDYSGRIRYPSTSISPGIMGPFSWVPFMECIHGLISMDHEVSGSISWNSENLDFNGGRGYIEKDRGRSMPEQWIWVHTNQFENSGDSLMLSVARIPWLGSSFTGHLGFLRYNGCLQRFGTYAGSKVSGVTAENGLDLQVKVRRRTLELGLEWEGKGGSLDAPVLGSMSREIIESPRSRVVAVLRENGVLLWESSAAPAAVEVAGDPAELLKFRNFK